MSSPILQARNAFNPCGMPFGKVIFNRLSGTDYEDVFVAMRW